MTRRQPLERLPQKYLRQLFVIVVMLGIACCSNGDKPQAKREKPQPMVETAMVEVKTLTTRLELTGSIEPTRVARMASPVEGPVIACLVREGDRVHAGQLLASLGRAKGDAAVAASARAELEREELELGRIEKLVKTGALPGEELDNTRVKVSETKAKLARAMERLGDYRISAPWSGIVSKVKVAVGDFVSSRAPLVEVFDPKSLVLRFAVPESKATQVGNGAAIEVGLDAYPGKTFTAKVARIYPEIDRRTHTLTVEGSIEEDVALTPGMFARLHLTLSSAPDAIAVPAESVLRREGNKTVVFVITKEGQAEQRPVKLGIEDAGKVQILEGVTKGEQVAVAGHTRLHDGMKVRLAKGDRTRGENAAPMEAQAPGKSQ